MLKIVSFISANTEQWYLRNFILIFNFCVQFQGVFGAVFHSVYYSENMILYAVITLIIQNLYLFNERSQA